MPLSEEELRLLEQMEQALAQEDPKFVSTLRGSSLERVARMRTIVAGVVFVLGIGMLMGGAISAADLARRPRVRGHARLGHHRPRRVARPACSAAAAAAQRRGPALRLRRQHPRRFDVIEGGRSGRSRRDAAPRREAATPARQQAPQAGHLHAAHGAALGAPPQPGLLSPAYSASGAAHQRHRPDPAPPAAFALHAAGHRPAPRLDRLDACASGAPDRACRTAPSGRRGRAVASPLHPDQQPLQRLEVLRPRPAPGRPRCGPARAVNVARASPARGRVRSRAALPRPLRRGGPDQRRRAGAGAG